MIEKGDLVIKRGKHEAKVYFVEGVDDESILLVNGVRDEYFEGEKDIELFHKQFRLLAKAEHLIEEEKRYWLKLKTTLPVSEKFRYLVLYKPEGEYIILNKGEGESHKSIFTESEIAQMDITGFEKVEVTE